MTEPGSPPPRDPPPKGWRGWVWRLWDGANSKIAIALVTSLAALFVTQGYQQRQARSTDLATRRAALERLVVELELRKDRLLVVCDQGALGRGKLSPQDLDNLGHRAMAIVAGDPKTVTSSPEFKDVHLASLLGQAELTAGYDPQALELQRAQVYLMSFTDQTDQFALQNTPHVVGDISGLIDGLQQDMATGRIPIPQNDSVSRPAPTPAAEPPLCTAAPAKIAAPAK